MNNIFENAYYGKPYKTRDNKKALYITSNCERNEVVVNYDGNLHNISLNRDTGRHYNFQEMPFDIVSEWKEEINEEELDKLADAYAENLFPNEDNVYTKALRKECGRDFKAGYRQGWEGKQ